MWRYDESAPAVQSSFTFIEPEFVTAVFLGQFEFQARTTKRTGPWSTIFTFGFATLYIDNEDVQHVTSRCDDTTF